MVSLRLLGGLSISRDDGPITGPAVQPSRLALLAHLAVPEPRTVSRDRLIALLWPDHDAARGRRNLSDALYVLRREMGEEVIAASGDALRLNADLVAVDVVRFEDAVARGAPREAAAVYAGPFLHGVYLRDTAAFERWVDEHRNRLARAYGEVLESLARAAEEAGEAREAVAWRSALAAERPFSTAAAIGLMRAWERAGDPAAALEAGHLHATRLREELDAAPDPRLEAELERIRTSPVSGSSALPAVGETGAPAPPRPTGGVPGEEPRSGYVGGVEVTGAGGGSERADGRRRRERLTSSGTAVATAVVIILALGVVFAVRGRTEPSSATAVEPDRVAVFPFRVTAASPSLGYLAEGLPVLLAAKLTGEGGLRAVDSRVTLAAWDRSVGDGEGVSSDRVRELAAGLGASAALVGEVVGDDDRMTVTARLMSVDGDDERRAAEVSGPVDSLPAAIDRLVAGLLVRAFDGNDARLLRSLTTGSLPALRAFLAGAEAWRRGHRDEAIVRYGEALDHDSAFALAAVRLAEAAFTLPGGSTGRNPTAMRGLELAMAARDRLGAADRVYLSALSRPRYPAVMFPWAEVIDRWEAVVHELTDRPEAWYQLGLHLAEFGSQTSRDDAHARAASAFSRALELDSTYTPALERLVRLAARAGDRRAVERLAPLYLARNPDGPTADYTRWRIALVVKDDAALGEQRRRLSGMDAVSLILLVGFGQVDAVGFEDVRLAAEELERRVRERTGLPGAYDRVTAAYVLKSHALNGGRPSRSDSLLRVRWEGRLDWPRYHHDRISAALYDGGDTAGVRASVRRLEQRQTAAMPTIKNVLSRTERGAVASDLCYARQWRLWSGDTTGAVAAIDSLRTWETVPGAPCAVVLELLLAAELGGEAAREARPLADRAVAQAWAWPMGYMIGFAAARLYERLGDPAAAAEALRQRPSRATQGSWTLGHALHEIGRLSLAAGDTAAALDAWRHWLALHDRPEASRRDDVERVRRLVSDLASDRGVLREVGGPL